MFTWVEFISDSARDITNVFGLPFEYRFMVDGMNACSQRKAPCVKSFVLLGSTAGLYRPQFVTAGSHVNWRATDSSRPVDRNFFFKFEFKIQNRFDLYPKSPATIRWTRCVDTKRWLVVYLPGKQSRHWNLFVVRRSCATEDTMSAIELTLAFARVEHRL